MSSIIRLITVVKSFFDFNGKKALKELDIKPSEVKTVYHAWIVIENEFGDKENITVCHGTWDEGKAAIQEKMFKLNNVKILGWRMRPARS